MIPGTQESAVDDDLSRTVSTPTIQPPQKKHKCGRDERPARDNPCCSCGPRNKCAQTATCSCKLARRACTSCDPGSFGNCRNTRSPSKPLRDLFEQQRKKNAVAITNSTPAKSNDDDDDNASKSPTDDPVLCGLINSDNTAKYPSSSAKQPPSDNKQQAYRDSSQESETADPSGPSEKENTVLNNNNTEGGGDEVTANGRDDVPIRNNSRKPNSGTVNDSDEETEEKDDASEEGEGMDGTKRNANAEQTDAEPVAIRFSATTQTVDAGSVGANGIFNRDNNYGPWDVEYRVIEDDPLLQQLNAADNLLMRVYGDTIHKNDGTHLDGGIEDNAVWQWRWSRVAAVNLRLWDVPRKCALGKRFVNLLANEFRGARLRKWNSERVVIFPSVILQRKPNMSAKQIKKVIEQRLDMWEAGRFKELCNEVINKGKSESAGLSPDEWDDDGASDNVAMRYNSLVLSGKIRAAVRMATSRGLGGPLGPDDTCSKTGKRVLDVLASKYPSISRPEALKDGSVLGFDVYPEYEYESYTFTTY